MEELRRYTKDKEATQRSVTARCQGRSDISRAQSWNHLVGATGWWLLPYRSRASKDTAAWWELEPQGDRGNEATSGDNI